MRLWGQIAVLAKKGFVAHRSHRGVDDEKDSAIFEWSRKHHSRMTMTPEQIERMTGREPPGKVVGVWDDAQFEAHFGKPVEERP